MWSFRHLGSDACLMFDLDAYLPISLTSYPSFQLPT